MSYKCACTILVEHQNRAGFPIFDLHRWSWQELFALTPTVQCSVLYSFHCVWRIDGPTLFSRTNVPSQLSAWFLDRAFYEYGQRMVVSTTRGLRRKVGFCGCCAAYSTTYDFSIARLLLAGIAPCCSVGQSTTHRLDLSNSFPKSPKDPSLHNFLHFLSRNNIWLNKNRTGVRSIGVVMQAQKQCRDPIRLISSSIWIGETPWY